MKYSPPTHTHKYINDFIFALHKIRTTLYKEINASRLSFWLFFLFSEKSFECYQEPSYSDLLSVITKIISTF